MLIMRCVNLNINLTQLYTRNVLLAHHQTLIITCTTISHNYIVILFFSECIEACAVPTSNCNYINYPVYPVGLNVTYNEAQANCM